jgi:hypothetical protein
MLNSIKNFFNNAYEVIIEIREAQAKVILERYRHLSKCTSCK